MSAACLFCRIAAGEIPAAVVARTDRLLAFADVNPQAPTHLLVIPREHYPDVAALVSADPVLTGALVDLARVVAEGAGLADGWRLVFNTGARAGQTVFHVHAHVLGGRSMAWPPG